MDGGSLSQPWAHVTETRFAAAVSKSFSYFIYVGRGDCLLLLVFLSNVIRRKNLRGAGIHEESRNKEVVAKTRNRQSKKGVWQ